MRKFFAIFLLSCTTSFLLSCNTKKKDNDEEDDEDEVEVMKEDPNRALTESEIDDIEKLCRRYEEAISNQDYKAIAKMKIFCEYKDESFDSDDYELRTLSKDEYNEEVERVREDAYIRAEYQGGRFDTYGTCSVSYHLYKEGKSFPIISSKPVVKYKGKWYFLKSW